MDFELTDDQVSLQEGMRSFCAGRVPLSEIRDLREPLGLDAGRWREVAEMGVFGLRLPEPEGVGLGWADAVLVFEELGRALVPGPLIWTHLLAGVLPGVADGSVSVTGVERRDAAGLVEFPGADRLVVVDDDGLWDVATGALPLGAVLACALAAIPADARNDERQTRYSLAGGCWAVQPASGGFLQRAGAGYNDLGTAPPRSA